MILTSPRYSFVQPYSDEDSCYPDRQLCLPISKLSNLAFHIRASAIDTLSMVFSDSIDIYGMIVPDDYPCTSSVQTTGTFSGTSRHIEAGRYELTNTSTNGSLEAWFNVYPFLTFDPSYTLPDDIAIGQCFKFLIIADCLDTDFMITRRYTIGCTQCFKRIPVNDCYSSVLTYSNPTNSFDFLYYSFPGFANKVELPIYLRDPVMENEQKVYTKSDGTIVKLYERKEELYTLETDQMPYTWHKALDIALSHDTVLISNPNTSSFDPVNTATQFVKKDNYEIEYNKAPLSAFGKGKCKLSNANPIHLVSNNCE